MDFDSCVSTSIFSPCSSIPHLSQVHHALGPPFLDQPGATLKTFNRKSLITFQEVAGGKAMFAEKLVNTWPSVQEGNKTAACS